MAKLIDSIKENDMLMPALVQPKEDGTYENDFRTRVNLPCHS